MAGRQSCLFVLTTAIEGVSAESFIQAFTLAQSAFNVQLASPDGRPVEFVGLDDNSRRWLNDFRSKSYAMPISFEAVEASRFSALVVPHSPGAVRDLPKNTQLAPIVEHFVGSKKLICTIGMGVAALFCCLSEEKSWRFKNYSLTSTTVFELATEPYFSDLKLIPEDFIKDNGGRFAGSEPNCVHVILDRHLITGQNEASTLTAVQNLILISNQRHSNGNSGK